jgi:hypothetical protein
MSETPITPKLLQEYARRLLVQPPGVHDPQDWDEMTTMFARAFNAAAARIEELDREVQVRDRALALAGLEVAGFYEEAAVAVSNYLLQARAELAREEGTADSD